MILIKLQIRIGNLNRIRKVYVCGKITVHILTPKLVPG